MTPIEKMAREAGGTVMAPYDYGDRPDRMILTFEDLERFAALVAGECARIVSDLEAYSYDDPGSSAAAAIRERFGIKE